MVEFRRIKERRNQGKDNVTWNGIGLFVLGTVHPPLKFLVGGGENKCMT
jgi:hypothetical protein